MIVPIVKGKHVTGKLHIIPLITNCGHYEDYYEVFKPFTARLIRRVRVTISFSHDNYIYNEKIIFEIFYKQEVT